VSTEADRRARWLLGIAGVAGIVAGVLASLRGPALPPARLPESAIVSVDGTPILREEWERAVSLLAGDRREPPKASDRARVLERLIDEELLVHHALAEGLVEHDRSVRDALLRAMIESIGADATSRAAEKPELRAFFEQERGNAPGGAGNDASHESFESQRPRLEAAFAARARDEALRDYLAGLRSRARIERADEVAR
jgi:hypothetical protein